MKRLLIIIIPVVLLIAAGVVYFVLDNNTISNPFDKSGIFSDAEFGSMEYREEYIIDQGILYSLTNRGEILAIDTVNGETKWTIAIYFPEEDEFFRIKTPLILQDNILYFSYYLDVW